MGINRHSAERVYQVIRRCLARECELHSPLGGEVECDESYFGGQRKGPRGEFSSLYLVVSCFEISYSTSLPRCLPLSLFQPA